MNYRHAFHAGNHADVFKHVVLLALCDALLAKPAPLFALDSHAGRGLYALAGEQALRTGEAQGGIARLRGGLHADIDRYLAAVAACRADHGADAYPGSPWLLAHALRGQDRIALCELQPEEAMALRQAMGGDDRIAIHQRDGYAALRALLPPRVDGQRLGRGLVLVDPPYEAQLAEFDTALDALHDALQRWPQGCYALWYPIKQRRSLRQFQREAEQLDAHGILDLQLLVRNDDSPLRMNGSGMLLLNPPWQFDARMTPVLLALAAALGEDGRGAARAQWLRMPD